MSTFVLFCHRGGLKTHNRFFSTIALNSNLPSGQCLSVQNHQTGPLHFPVAITNTRTHAHTWLCGTMKSAHFILVTVSRYSVQSASWSRKRHTCTHEIFWWVWSYWSHTELIIATPAVHMKNTHTCLFTSRCTHLCSGLTCAHGDGLYELVPPAVGPHQQSQVGLLYQLVHCVLPEDREITRIRRESPACSLSIKIPKWFIFTRICHLTFRRREKSGAFVADCFTAFTGTILSEQTQMFSEFLAGEDGERSDRLMEQSVTTVLSMGPWWTGNKGVY